MIKRIKLVNWRSHENTELEFDRGINVIMGRMGAGKSSITDAICFALYSTFPNLQKKVLRLDDVIMRSPKEKKTAVVELWFEAGNHECYVKRIIERGKGTTTSELRIDGKLAEGPKSVSVTKAVEKILGMDYELFTRAVYSEQNNIDYFLSLRPSERKKKIDELLLIDKFEKMRSSSVSILNRAKERMNERLYDIQNFNERELKDRFEVVKSEVEKLSKNIEDGKKKLGEIKVLIKKKGDSLEKMEEELKNLNEMKRTISKLNGRVESLKSQIEKYGKYDNKKFESLTNRKRNLENEKIDEEKKIKELEDKIRTLENELGKYITIKSQIEKNLKEIESFNKKKKELESIYESIERLEERISSGEDSLKNLQIKLGSKESELKSRDESINKLKESGDKCPVCGSVLTKEKKEKLIEERKKEISDINKEIKKIRKEIEELKEKLKIFRRDKILWEKINFRIESLGETNVKPYEEKLNKIRKEISELEKILKVEREKYDRISSELSDIENNLKNMELSKSIEAEIEKTEKEIELIKTRMNDIKFDEKKYKNLQNEIMLLSEEKSKIETSVSKDLQRLSDKKETMNEIENQLKILSKYKIEYKILEKMVNVMEKFKKSLETTQIKLRNNLIDLVNRNMSSIWRDFYPYEEIEDIRLNVLENDYRLELFNGNEWIPVDGIASGGERTTAAITLRMALSISLVKQLRWIVLDEPTHNLDETAIETFSFILREKLSSLVEQIFIITHEEKLEDAVTGSFYKLVKEKGITKPVREKII